MEESQAKIEPTGANLIELFSELLEGQECLEKVKKCFRNSEDVVSILGLSYCDGGDALAEAVGEVLTQVRGITKVSMTKNQIGEKGMESLACGLQQNQMVKRLQLSNNNIRGQGAVALAEILNDCSFESISLRGNAIKDHGAKAFGNALKTSKTPTFIDLAENGIGDDGARGLAECLRCNKHLKLLNLSENNIGNQGAMEIAESVIQNDATERIHEIYLEKNQISDEGAEAFKPAFQKSKVLAYLSLYKNPVNDRLLTDLSLLAGKNRIRFRGYEEYDY